MKTIGFNEMGRRYRRGASDAGDRLTRREAAAAVTAMQKRKDKPGDRIYKPLKPPPTKFAKRVTRAAEVDAAKYNAGTTSLEEVATHWGYDQRGNAVPRYR